jgi:Mitochondrial degradasome RNA helicase subunit C terminal
MDVMKRFAQKHAKGQPAGLKSNMIPRRAANFEDLDRLCGIYNDIELFLWLQKKFPPANMMEYQTAVTLRELTIKYITEGLARVGHTMLDLTRRPQQPVF